MPRPLYIEPSDKVEFVGTFTKPITTSVRVKNYTGKRMSYKLKASDKSRLKLRPGIGILKTGEQAEVEVTFKGAEVDEYEVAELPVDGYHISLYETAARDEALSARQLWAADAAKAKKRKKKVTCCFRLGPDPVLPPDPDEPPVFGPQLPPDPAPAVRFLW